MADLRINVEGLDEHQRKLARLGLLLRDLRPFWPKVSSLFIAWESAQFDSEGQFLTGGWQPLSPAYAAWKAQHYPGKRILSRTGALRRAATSPRRVARPLMLELYIDPYPVDGREADPGWFQEGTATMPARPLLAETLPLSAYAQVQGAAEEYARDLVKQLGL